MGGDLPRNDLTNYDFRTAGHSHTHHGHVMRALGLRIISGDYAENSILPGDAELFERFGVSRTVLREALKTLAAKGLIANTFVKPVDSWELADGAC